MSFFQDIPPPLDDEKIKDVDDFDLENEVIDEEKCDIVPEIPSSDFDVYNSSRPPPELSSALFFDATPPPDDYDPSKSQEDSFDDDPEFHYHLNNFTSNEGGDEKKVIETNQNTVIMDAINSSITSEDVIKLTSDKEENSERVLENSHNDDDHKYLSTEPLDINQNLTQISSEKIEIAVDNKDSSFSTSLACNDDDKIEENLHNEFSAEFEPLEDINYAQAINFIENLSSETEEEKINQTVHDEIVTTAESVPELKFDDEDDDFNDFETAIPAHRHIEYQPVVNVEQASEEIHFEADFSGFEAFNDATTTTVDDDDDDFGDFNDFTQAPAAITSNSTPITQESQPIEFMKPSNINVLLAAMFPNELCEDNESQEEEENDHSKEHLHNVMKSDDIVKRLDDFDGTLALGYLYASSTSSQILVRSLGIDVRNILLGAQWNSSSMPRFAANLSFNPLEPLKPSVAALTPSSSSTTKVDLSESKISAPQPLKPTGTTQHDVIPEVEFDWNSSGLVNPLDGKQPNTQQSDDDAKAAAVFKSSPLPPPVSLTPPLQPSATTAATTTFPHSFENESLSYEVDEEEMTQSEVESGSGLDGIDIDAGLSKFTSWQNDAPPPSFTSASSSSIIVRERTIKLPETHIFTPVKSTSPVSREVISRDESPSKIVVKEYHDIEYSLEPKRSEKVEIENEFDDFQSAPTPQPVMMPSLTILEPQKVEIPKTNSEISWPNPGNVIVDDDFGFMNMPAATNDLSIDIPAAAATKSQTNEKKKEFSKPVIGNSPSKHPPVDEDDDDFADFQAAPVNQYSAIKNSKPDATASFNDFEKYSNSHPVMQFSVESNPPEKKQNTNEPLTLSPSKLANTMKNHDFSQKPSWISSIDDDEVKRIEAAFPKCKVSPRPQQKIISTTDEDDWTDFVGATTSAPSNQSYQNVTMQNHQSADDWSDFVSVPPPTVNSISSQILNKPNFTSWNQPSRPYVHHATSFLSSEPKNYNSSNTSRSGMTITNNFNYHHQQNGISTIIPDLQFSMPKNLINLPSTRSGGGSESSGKK